MVTAISAFEWSWNISQARAIDAFGEMITTEVKDGHLRLWVSLTPVFIEPKDAIEETT